MLVFVSILFLHTKPFVSPLPYNYLVSLLLYALLFLFFFFFQAEDGIRDGTVTGVQTLCSSDLVMFGIAPDANIIDVNHQVPRFSIRDGAASLIFALPHMPVGVHLAVVDPGVGTERLPIAIKVARGDVLIGPDNGLLIEAAERLGGIVEARAIENRDQWLPVVSSSFYGRDIFAPTTAHLAMGTPFESVGPVVPIDDLVRISRPQAKVAADR